MVRQSVCAPVPSGSSTAGPVPAILCQFSRHNSSVINIGCVPMGVASGRCHTNLVATARAIDFPPQVETPQKEAILLSTDCVACPWCDEKCVSVIDTQLPRYISSGHQVQIWHCMPEEQRLFSCRTLTTFGK